MPTKPIGPLARVWAGWKSLKLPWRRHRLVGMDLNGTTFWEFKDQLAVGRFRRIAKHPHTIDYADIKITPQWHQWLRHTRNQPPSIEEQQADVQRQIQLKQLVRIADQRWATKASYLDAPEKTGQAGPATLPLDRGGYKGQTEEGLKAEEPPRKGKAKENPWKQERGGPSENWQPQSWQPGQNKV